jgi:hypothetical protein
MARTNNKAKVVAILDILGANIKRIYCLLYDSHCFVKEMHFFLARSESQAQAVAILELLPFSQNDAINTMTINSREL